LRTHVRWGLPALLLLAFALVGCDAGGSKREAQYERLVGTWTLIDLQQGGFSWEEDELSAQLTFRDGEAGRTYRLRRVSATGDTTTVEGGLDLLGSNTLSLSGGFSRPLVWTFTFEEPDVFNDSVRFTLQSRWEGAPQAFLSALGLSGTRQPLEMDLEFQ
jgi:hypothetical protein